MRRALLLLALCLAGCATARPRVETRPFTCGSACPRPVPLDVIDGQMELSDCQMVQSSALGPAVFCWHEVP